MGCRGTETIALDLGKDALSAIDIQRRNSSGEASTRQLIAPIIK